MRTLSRSVAFLILGVLMIASILLQFLTPVLYEADDYYHIAVARFIKESGLHFPFRWADYSTFKTCFADKDLLLHLVALPFTYLTKDPVLAAKYTIILCNAAFLAAFALVLKKFLPLFLVPYFLVSVFLSPTFTLYYLYLRPTTIVNILTIAGICFLITKRHWGVFFVSALYALGHVSFPLFAVYAVLCELVRYAYKKEFFLRNIGFTVLGITAGVCIHPHFPFNLLSVYLNGILVPFYAFSESPIHFGRELYPILTKKALLDNLMTFFILAYMAWSALVSRVRASVSTLVFFGCANICLALSFMGNRFWYTANPLVVVSAASYMRDWWDATYAVERIRPAVRRALIAWALASLVAGAWCVKSLGENIEQKAARSMYYERAAQWMKDRIPAGETIYHSFWDDSPYFICLNPKNKYLVVLDPIYMYYWSPGLYRIYQDLMDGVDKNAYVRLTNTFHLRYGYTKKNRPFYSTIARDKRFRIMYEDAQGVVFQVASRGGGGGP